VHCALLDAAKTTLVWSARPDDAAGLQHSPAHPARSLQGRAARARGPGRSSLTGALRGGGSGGGALALARFRALMGRYLSDLAARPALAARLLQCPDVRAASPRPARASSHLTSGRRAARGPCDPPIARALSAGRAGSWRFR